MPNYRIEISANGRAGCQDTVCKTNKDKIKKGMLRLGTWVDYDSEQFPASWKWRHWGCTSGEIIKHIRADLGRDGNGDYDWDRLDGWEEIVNNTEIRDKVQRVIKQGHIDPEDFNGDPEFNKLGQKGIRGRAPRKKKNAADDEEQAEEPTTSQATPKPATKRGRKSVKDEDENEPPAKKTKKSAVKKGVKDEHSDEDAKALDEVPAAKTKGKRGAAKKVTAVKDESGAEEPAQKVSARPQRGAGKKAAVYKEEDASEEDELKEDETPKKKTAAAKGKGKRGAAKKAATPEESEAEPEFESEQADEVSEEVSDEGEPEEDSEPEEPVVKKKPAKAKGGAKPKAKRGQKA
ncbi:hypothetical protein QBC37DRAFT_167332 [Rhypophila decipiens]|uniref:PARP-type domain-containing protein n=1 Tax=Rhypophila decipiens TaxID=261697 RepID=A0AAN7BD83_9PEZI|nr:hypothetical protein QBC37DRAFT_167332 [Rhypophila decipiens]